MHVLISPGQSLPLSILCPLALERMRRSRSCALFRIENALLCAEHWISSKNNTYKGLRYLNSTHNFKLVRYDDSINFEELFDLSSDPHEIRNIIGKAPKSLVNEMRDRLAMLRGCGLLPTSTVPCP